MGQYLADVCFVEGILLYQNQNVNVEWPDSSADVDTIPGGAQGVAPGPQKCRITVQNARPKGGPEVNLMKAWKEGTPLEVKAQQMGTSKKVQGKFIVREYSIGSATGDVPTENATLQSVGPVPILE